MCLVEFQVGVFSPVVKRGLPRKAIHTDNGASTLEIHKETIIVAIPGVFVKLYFTEV